ncbi:MAG: hypothetical protein M0P61_00340 [Ignavibacteriaceae bacterium]|jgi:hypothetical protein|nr:hypothetical protein [Ignavibacteriaceae bacterium]
MSYTKISLFGERKGVGTFETFFNTGKYKSIDEAIKINDYVIVDFVKDDKGIIYFEIKHSQRQNESIYHRLNIQRPICGIDVSDDVVCCEIVETLL